MKTLQDVYNEFEFLSPVDARQVLDECRKNGVETARKLAAEMEKGYIPEPHYQSLPPFKEKHNLHY